MSQCHFKAKCSAFTAFHRGLAQDPIGELTVLPQTHRGLLLRGWREERQKTGRRVELEGEIWRTQHFWRGAPYDRTTQNVVATPLHIQ